MRLLRTIFLLLIVSRLSLAQSVFPVRDEGEAPNRSYDVLHYKIEVSFDEPKKTVMGKVSITLVPFLTDLQTIELDAEEMQIREVRLAAKKVMPFEVRPKTLAIHLDRSYSSRDTLTVTVDYTCTPKKGLYFVQPDSGYPDKPWQIWTQGEDMDNHFWFPCYDFPNDKATSEIIATVQSKYTLVANGKLASVKEDKKNGMKTFHWVESKPHASYLIMLAAGEYAVLKDKARNVPVEYYVYPQHVEDAKVCFQQTPDMIQFFSRKIGFAYPWEKYAQVLIADFIYGGMENTSATTLLDNISVYDARARVDQTPTGLIAHELAHQWWGDVVTCKDWRHLWLNESFASYFGPLYHEYSQGRDEFDYSMYGSQNAGIRADTTLGRKPIVSVGSYSENVYPRGASVLHMIRFILGDQLFWQAIHHYITKNQFTSVETNDLKKAIEEVTGQNLYWFFNEWVYKAGHPIFDVSYQWNESTRMVFLTVKQIQKVDSLTGVFRTPLDIEITSPSGKTTSRVEIFSKDTTFALSSPAKPQLVIFDKGNWLIKELKFKKSKEEWSYQAEFATNPVDRIRALLELVKISNNEESVPLFARISLKDPFWAVRREAITSLGEVETKNETVKEQMKTALVAAYKDPKSVVRNAAIAQLGKYKGIDVTATLHTALNDSSYGVVSSALRSLTKADSLHAGLMIGEYIEKPSYRNQVANTALSVLATVDSAKAIQISFQKAKYGQPVFARMAALDVLGKYGKKRQDVMTLFISLLKDNNTNVKASVIRTLGDVGDEKVLPELEKITKDKNGRIAETAKASIERIKKRKKG